MTKQQKPKPYLYYSFESSLLIGITIIFHCNTSSLLVLYIIKRQGPCLGVYHLRTQFSYHCDFNGTIHSNKSLHAQAVVGYIDPMQHESRERVNTGPRRGRR